MEFGKNFDGRKTAVPAWERGPEDGKEWGRCRASHLLPCLKYGSCPCSPALPSGCPAAREGLLQRGSSAARSSCVNEVPVGLSNSLGQLWKLWSGSFPLNLFLSMLAYSLEMFVCLFVCFLQINAKSQAWATLKIRDVRLISNCEIKNNTLSFFSLSSKKLM